VEANCNEIDGTHGEDKYLPHLLGHEGFWHRRRIGPNITKIKKGDYVVISWIKGSGINAPGVLYGWGKRKVKQWLCCSVLQKKLLHLKIGSRKFLKKIPLDVAALLGLCNTNRSRRSPQYTSYSKRFYNCNIWYRWSWCQRITGAVLMGAKEIIAIDISPEKLKLAKKLGATMTINALQKDPVAVIKKKYPQGIDYAVEAAGVASVMEQAFASLSNTGTLGIAGSSKRGEQNITQSV